MPSELIDRIDLWAHANEATRSDSIRRLVEFGLAAQTEAAKK